MSSKTISWEGRADRNAKFGLEMQTPFAQYLLDGRKTIETRAYALPPSLLSTLDHDVKIDILQSEKGQDGVSAIPNIVSLAQTNPLLKRIGWTTFTQSFRYISREQFDTDVKKHLVDNLSDYGWSDDRPMYGWVVDSCGVYTSNDDDDATYDIAERCMRSLFQLKRQTTIVITGASGMLGRALLRVLLPNPSIRVIGTGHTRLQVNGVALHKLDLLDFDSTTAFMQKYQPDVVVHCAAERYPDKFETNLEESIKLNVESTRHLATECLKLASGDKQMPCLIYISTSYVFDGGSISKEFPPYMLQSKTNPINSYGKSKWDGECVVREILGKGGFVVRVPLLYGLDCTDLGESPALEMMKSFLPSTVEAKRKQIDHWAQRFPTSVEDVSRVLKIMIDRILNKTLPLENSTYHVSSPYSTTKYELMQLQTKLLNISASTVEERTSANSTGPSADSAPRPQCTQLDCSETLVALGQEQFEFTSLEDGMKKALSGFPERFVKE